MAVAVIQRLTCGRLIENRFAIERACHATLRCYIRIMVGESAPCSIASWGFQAYQRRYRWRTRSERNMKFLLHRYCAILLVLQLGAKLFHLVLRCSLGDVRLSGASFSCLSPPTFGHAFHLGFRCASVTMAFGTNLELFSV